MHFINCKASFCWCQEWELNTRWRDQQPQGLSSWCDCRHTFCFSFISCLEMQAHSTPVTHKVIAKTNLFILEWNTMWVTLRTHNKMCKWALVNVAWCEQINDDIQCICCVLSRKRAVQMCWWKEECSFYILFPLLARALIHLTCFLTKLFVSFLWSFSYWHWRWRIKKRKARHGRSHTAPTNNSWNHDRSIWLAMIKTMANKR